MIAGILGIRYYLYEQQKKQVCAYASEVAEYVLTVEDTVADLEHVNSMWNIVEDSTTLYYYTLKNYARSLCAGSIAEVKSSQVVILETYDELMKFSVDDVYANQLKESVQDVKTDYLMLYNLVIESEVGGNEYSISTLKSEMTDLTNLCTEIQAVYGSDK